MPDAAADYTSDAARMSQTYGVIWRNHVHGLARGRLELGGGSLRLVGSDGTVDDIVEEIGYDELAGVHVGRLPSERIGGLRTLVIDRTDGSPIAIAGITEPGAIGELADRLGELQRSSIRRRAAVVVPIEPGSHGAVTRLLADGPPFEPAALGIEEHTVYLSADEVVFVFDWCGDATIDTVLEEPAFWAHAAAWGEHLAGAPRLAESAYHWSRPRASQ